MTFFNLVLILAGVFFAAQIIGALTSTEKQESAAAMLKRGLAILMLLFLLFILGMYVWSDPELLQDFFEELKQIIQYNP